MQHSLAVSMPLFGLEPLFNIDAPQHDSTYKKITTSLVQKTKVQDTQSNSQLRQEPKDPQSLIVPESSKESISTYGTICAACSALQRTIPIGRTGEPDIPILDSMPSCM